MAFENSIPPEPGKRLFAEVFEGKSPQFVAETVEGGIQAVIGNVERLLGDIDHLCCGGRVAAASFFLATADEEVAKVFILIDACRLDPEKHGSVLRNLCKAFYNHEIKSAYNSMRRYRPVVNGMVTAWRSWTKRWRPESPDPEMGEPAMPHATYFDREMPLYVDWDYASKWWFLPDNTLNAWKFGDLVTPNPVDGLLHELVELKGATESKLLSAEALKCVNDVWNRVYVNWSGPECVHENRPAPEVVTAEHELVERLSAKFGLSKEYVSHSPLLGRPLYHFTTLAKE